MSYVPVLKPGTNKLIFKYDPIREIIEIQERGVKTVIDLTQYKAPASAQENVNERQVSMGENRGRLPA